MPKVYRLVCRLCKVVFISLDDYGPVENLHCFCGAVLTEYVTDDHWQWERIPVSRARLLQHLLKEVKAEHAKTGSD